MGGARVLEFCSPACCNPLATSLAARLVGSPCSDNVIECPKDIWSVALHNALRFITIEHCIQNILEGVDRGLGVCVDRGQPSTFLLFRKDNNKVIWHPFATQGVSSSFNMSTKSGVWTSTKPAMKLDCQASCSELQVFCVLNTGINLVTGHTIPSPYQKTIHTNQFWVPSDCSLNVKMQ